MKLIPGLPRLERKPDPSECAVPGCTRNWFTQVHTWPVCWLHYCEHLDAENMEHLARQSHTARLIESAPTSGLTSKRPCATKGAGRDLTPFPSGAPSSGMCGGVPFVFHAARPAEGKSQRHNGHPRTTKRAGGFLR